MAVKIKLTRPELKRYRDALRRYERYLPMLKLKQQQLQLTIRDVKRKLAELGKAVVAATRRLDPYRPVLADVAGVDIQSLAEPTEVKTTRTNIAGVNMPVFHDAAFGACEYSLFATPAWVDTAVADLREISRKTAERDVVKEQYVLLDRELTVFESPR